MQLVEVRTYMVSIKRLTTKQYIRGSYLAQAGFVAFGKWGTSHLWVPVC